LRNAEERDSTIEASPIDLVSHKKRNGVNFARSSESSQSNKVALMKLKNSMVTTNNNSLNLGLENVAQVESKKATYEFRTNVAFKPSSLSDFKMPNLDRIMKNESIENFKSRVAVELGATKHLNNQSEE